MNTRIASTLAAFARHPEATLVPFRVNQERIRQQTRVRARDYVKQRRKRDEGFRIMGALRGRLRAALKAQQVILSRDPRTSATKRMLGCSVAELMDYLATLFVPGMTWANYGEWELDHVRPCKAFDLSRRVNQLACFHYTNLQPLWKSDNRRKSSKWNDLWCEKKFYDI